MHKRCVCVVRVNGVEITFGDETVIQRSRTEEAEHLKEMQVHFPKEEILLYQYDIAPSLIGPGVKYQVVSFQMFLNFAAKVVVLFDNCLDASLSVSLFSYVPSKTFQLREHDGNTSCSTIEGLERLVVPVLVVVGIFLAIHGSLPVWRGKK